MLTFPFVSPDSTDCLIVHRYVTMVIKAYFSVFGVLVLGETDTLIYLPSYYSWHCTVCCWFAVIDYDIVMKDLGLCTLLFMI